MDIFRPVLILVMIALSAFFVACEFAIVKVRSSRIDQLISEGNKNAVTAKKMISNVDAYLSATQLGITVVSLVLGWIGEKTVSDLLSPVFETLHINGSLTHVLSVIISFSIITFIHVVIGELAPKSIAIQKAESVTLFLAKPLYLFYRVAYPFTWLLNGASSVVIRMLGLKAVSESDDSHSEEELRIILSDSYKSGEINQSEFKYVNKIFEFDDRIAKEIMVPRTEIVSHSVEDSLATFIKTVREERFTRYPIIDGDKDHIIGIVNVKEVLTDFIEYDKTALPDLKSYIRPIIRVIETIPIQDLLVMMQKERIHMAVLLDEYGGTSGLVTVEDILEEIVGEIRDEFDSDEVPLVRKLKDDHYLIDSKSLISDVNQLLGIELQDDDVDTIGGWILTENYEAKQGDIIPFAGYEFIIKTVNEDMHVKYIEVKKNDVTNVPLHEQSSVSLSGNAVS